MSALDVIAVPDHPGMYARRCAVEAWRRAGSPPLRDAGRLYAAQKRAYDGWKAHRPGFSPADNPDDETQRLAHVRFVAFDLANPSRDAAAMRRAGFLFPYDYEPWHAELPNVRGYSIVRFIPTTTQPQEDDDMGVMLYLYLPTNSLLLVDHVNKRIRNLGNSEGSSVRDYYSQRPYVKATDQHLVQPGLVDWAEATAGYVYVP